MRLVCGLTFGVAVLMFGVPSAPIADSVLRATGPAFADDHDDIPRNLIDTDGDGLVDSEDGCPFRWADTANGCPPDDGPHQPPPEVPRDPDAPPTQPPREDDEDHDVEEPDPQDDDDDTPLCDRLSDVIVPAPPVDGDGNIDWSNIPWRNLAEGSRTEARIEGQGLALAQIIACALDMATPAVRSPQPVSPWTPGEPSLAPLTCADVEWAPCETMPVFTERDGYCFPPARVPRYCTGQGG